MADIFQEVDEALRKERAEAFWKQYGKIVVGVCLVIVLATAGYTWWESQRSAELRQLADRYGIAADQAEGGNLEAAHTTLVGLAESAGDKGIGLVARLQAAALLAESDDHAGAVSAYDAVATDPAVDVLYRDLAVLMAILHGDIAGEDRASLLARIEPLTADGEPWRFTARMIAASLAIGTGDVAAAEEYLTQVTDDPEAPSSARGQAAEILQAMGS